jgi:TldD protein
MLDHALLAELVADLLSSGGDYADIFVESKSSTTLHLEDDKLEKVVSGIDRGIGLRLVVGDKTAFGYSNDFGRPALSGLAASLRASVAGGGVGASVQLAATSPAFPQRVVMQPDSVAMQEKVDLVVGANRTARAVDKRVRQVSVVYRDSVQRMQVATSEGVLAEDERIHSLAAVQVIAADGGVIQTGYESNGGLTGFELFSGNRVEELSLAAARRAVMMLGARRATGGRMPIVISSSAGGTMIHEAVGHGLEADLVGQGLSVYAGKMGAQVASSIVSVVDDATLPGKRGSFSCDDEGAPAERTLLVDRGILVGFLCDKVNALRSGGRSTGNGRRESYRHRPIPRMTNTFIVPGSDSPEAILRETARGLFVKKMGGGQVNTATGDFVFDVQEGHRIENGRIGEPVRGATLTGNGLAVLMAIDRVGSDLGFSIGTCGKDSQGVPVSDALPTVRIAEMVVGGEVPVLQ